MLLIVSISTKQQLEMVTSSYNDDGEETHYDALVMGKAKHPTSGEIGGQ